MPASSAWAEPGRPLRVEEPSVPKGEKKALACYGLLTRCPADPRWQEQLWLRFVAERPVSAITVQFLAWSCRKLEQQGKKALLLIWDNASWHVSREARGWIRAHNRGVRKSGNGVRIVVCALPVKSPWLNPIEPKWVHGKRAVAEPRGLVPIEETERRICAHFACEPEPHLTLPEVAA